jgi:hypothetical protein
MEEIALFHDRDMILIKLQDRGHDVPLYASWLSLASYCLLFQYNLASGLYSDYIGGVR